MFQGAYLIQIHCLKGAHFDDFTPKKSGIATFAWLATKACISTSQMCPLKQLCAPYHGSRGCKIKEPGTQFCVKWGPNGDLDRDKWKPKTQVFVKLSVKSNFVKMFSSTKSDMKKWKDRCCKFQFLHLLWLWSNYFVPRGNNSMLYLSCYNLFRR